MGCLVETLTIALHFSMSYSTYEEKLHGQLKSRQVTKVRGRFVSGCSVETLATKGEQTPQLRQLCMLWRDQEGFW